MAGKALKLTVDIYDQPMGDGRDAPVERRTRGEVFQARDQSEYDRLVRIGAAVDPEEEQRLEQQRLQARRDQLERDRAALDAELKQVRGEQQPAKRG